MAIEMKTAEKWPNFFIVGAPRAGTTSLYHYLKTAPGVYMSPVKEPHYFAVTLKALLNARAKPPGMPVIHERGEYLKLFQEVKDEVAVGEASPSYLWDPAAPGLIHEVVPHARIIMSLRDPVARAFSHYLMHVRDGVERLPFEEVLEAPSYIPLGLYTAQVQRYFDIFGADHIKILIFEEFTRDPEAAVNDILKFLRVNGRVSHRLKTAHNSFGVPRGNLAKRIAANRGVRLAARSLLPSGIRGVLGEKLLYKKPPKPPMSDAVAAALADIYREDVKALEKILGRSLPWTLSGK
jgi:sulfotransferase family protein